MTIEVRPVRGRMARNRFVDLPFQFFGQDPTWIPPLRMAVHDRLSAKHPANAHQKTALWMAYRDGRPVGRIGACVDRLFNEFQGLSWAWVGFFECHDDPGAAEALFDQAGRWAKTHQATICVGPASFTTNDECGLLVEGFEHPPLVLTPQNPPYYEQLWTEGGWAPAMDLLAWRLDRSLAISDRQKLILEKRRQRAGVTVRSIRMKDFDAEVGRYFDVYNSAWALNWGFVPMEEAEVRHLAKNLKQVIDPELALVAEGSDGKPVAVALCLPDVNQVLQRVRSGRLLPMGWWRLLRGLPRVDRARILALGVRPEAQTRGLGPILYEAMLERFDAKPQMKMAEASWVLATNNPMNTAVEAMGGQRYKTWRMYQREL